MSRRSEQSASAARGPRHRARRRAIQALYQRQLTGQEPGEIVEQFRAEQSMAGVDDAYFETLVRRVVEAMDSLDADLGAFLDRPMAQIDPVERSVLRLAAWELRHCPEVPWRVVVNEAVELARTFGAVQGHAYVNGVLDRAARDWRGAEIGT